MQLKIIILIMSSVIYLLNAYCLSWYLFDDDLEVYNQHPQLACLNYSSYLHIYMLLPYILYFPELACLKYSSYLHISMLLPYILYFSQGEYFSSLFGFQNMYWKREKAGECMYPYLCLPLYPLPMSSFYQWDPSFFSFLPSNKTCCCRVIGFSAADTVNDPEGAGKLQIQLQCSFDGWGKARGRLREFSCL